MPLNTEEEQVRSLWATKQAGQARLASKYGQLVGGHPHSGSIAQLVDNQVSFFKQMEILSPGLFPGGLNAESLILAFVRALKESTLFNVASVQSMIGPLDQVFHYSVPNNSPLQEFIEGVYEETSHFLAAHELTAVSRMSRARFSEATNVLRSCWSSGRKQEEFYQLYANELIGEFKQGILSDIYNGASLLGSCKRSEIISKILELSPSVKRGATVGPANIIVTSTKFEDAVRDQDQFYVEIDKFFPSDQVMFYRRPDIDPFDTSYVFCPYILFQVSPTYLDPGDFSINRVTRSRFAGYFLGGAGKLTVV